MADEIDRPILQQIRPYCKEIRIINHYYNLEKIGGDYGIENVRVCGWGHDEKGSYATFYGDEVRSFNIYDDLIQSKYTIDREETCYVCSQEEVRYWRKAYDIQEWFHEHIPVHVENTGYYVLTEKILTAFNKAFKDEKLPVESPEDGQALVYWEWY